jgi:hypothetical protein
MKTSFFQFNGKQAKTSLREMIPNVQVKLICRWGMQAISFIKIKAEINLQEFQVDLSKDLS